MELVFLGTGGGRFVTTTQRRATGGILFKGEKTVLIDPGPGSLLRFYQFGEDPRGVDVLLISHRHTDHCAGAIPIIEAMTRATKVRRGVLIAHKDVLEETEDYPMIPRFHQNLLSERHSVNDFFEYDNIKTFPTQHTCSGIGFVIGDVGYTGDTGYSESLLRCLKGIKKLVINLGIPDKKLRPKYPSAGLAELLINEIKPKLAIITHFGISALRYGPEKLARELSESTGVRVIPANDGMRINLSGLVDYF